MSAAVLERTWTPLGALADLIDNLARLVCGDALEDDALFVHVLKAESSASGAVWVDVEATRLLLPSERRWKGWAA